MNKTIHYIWLGKNKKSRLIKQCIKSWQLYFPDWTIKEWNEDNLDIDLCEFCREAYDAKKYAFVADVIRFDVLYKYGGLYFDTDVKVVNDFSNIIDKYNAFAGYEYNMVAPGLVLYAGEAGNPIMGMMVEKYKNNHFIVDGKENQKVVGEYFSELLEEFGFVYEDKIQQCGEFTVLSSDYFCPTDAYGNRINYTDNTHSIHLYAASWMPFGDRTKRQIKKICYKYIGFKRIQFLMDIIKRRK